MPRKVPFFYSFENCYSFEFHGTVANRHFSHDFLAKFGTFWDKNPYLLQFLLFATEKIYKKK